jgi:hypothetical protein
MVNLHTEMIPKKQNDLTKKHTLLLLNNFSNKDEISISFMFLSKIT